jgi:hypothetical protein
VTDPAASLYSCGWRQGSTFELELVWSAMVVEDGTGMIEQRTRNDRWIVATQDCDLARAGIDDNEPVIEVRPLAEGRGSGDWGIRSAALRVTDSLVVEARSCRLLVSPRLLHEHAAGARVTIDDGRAIALKTWLGLRYDRPAVPEEFVDLARAIAKSVKRQRKHKLEDATHDILMQLQPGEPPRFVLYAVVVKHADGGADEGQVAAWLSAVALDIDPTLGVLAAPPIVVDKSRLSLAVLEASYAADLSAITWKRPTPHGVT